MMNEEQIDEGVITSIEINRCIAILSQLNNDTNQIFDIPKEQRTALIRAAGQFSRPDRDELHAEKDGAKATKRKMEKDRTARKETGIRFARVSYIYGTKTASCS
jgi:predicted phage gp36 major capsid-like protein